MKGVCKHINAFVCRFFFFSLCHVHCSGFRNKLVKSFLYWMDRVLLILVAQWKKKSPFFPFITYLFRFRMETNVRVSQWLKESNGVSHLFFFCCVPLKWKIHNISSLFRHFYPFRKSLYISNISFVFCFFVLFRFLFAYNFIGFLHWFCDSNIQSTKVPAYQSSTHIHTFICILWPINNNIYPNSLLRVFFYFVSFLFAPYDIRIYGQYDDANETTQKQ